VCTLTVFPSAKGTIITMNRDEADSRAEAGEYLETDATEKLLRWWPVDSLSRGTWFGARADGLVAALLNRYQGLGTTPLRSRGLIIPWVLKEAPYSDLDAFIIDKDWQDYAPFDLVLVCNGQILQCSWEAGAMQVKRTNDKEAYFLSSSSVEYEASLKVREAAFERFIAQQEISPEGVIEHLHRIGHSENPSLGFRMVRPGRRTKSISQAIVGAQGVEHRYLPLPPLTV
jgi:uncharacterized protein with NRDE domain